MVATVPSLFWKRSCTREVKVGLGLSTLMRVSKKSLVAPSAR